MTPAHLLIAAVAASWLSLATSQPGVCTPGVVRMALIDDVNEGGVCQEGPTNGNIYCAFVPADVYECCGPGRTVLDCMSSLCCGADDVVEPEVGDTCAARVAAPCVKVLCAAGR